MKIGIIGAGIIATLARKLAATGHEVKLANSKEPDTIRDLAREIGATAISKDEAVQRVAVIVLAIPFAKYPDLANLFSDVPADVVVIDTSNYYPFRDGAIAEDPGDHRVHLGRVGRAAIEPPAAGDVALSQDGQLLCAYR